MSRVGSRPSWMVGESASAEPAMQQNEIDEQAARQREMLAAKREENIRRCSPTPGYYLVRLARLSDLRVHTASCVAFAHPCRAFLPRHCSTPLVFELVASALQPTCSVPNGTERNSQRTSPYWHCDGAAECLACTQARAAAPRA